MYLVALLSKLVYLDFGQLLVFWQDEYNTTPYNDLTALLEQRGTAQVKEGRNW